MVYDDNRLRRAIAAAVARAFEKNPVTTESIIDCLLVQLRPVVLNENEAYTMSQLRDLLSRLF